MPLRSKSAIPITVPRARRAAAAGPVLSVPYVRQTQTQWCWAACTQMVAAFFGKTVRQCELANFLHGQFRCCTQPASPACNQPSPWQGVLSVYAHVDLHCEINTWAVSAAVVVNELQQSRPVEVGYLWFGGGGHVAVIYGVSPQGFFAVHDPWYGSGVYAYQALLLAYGQGRWAMTFGNFSEATDGPA